MVGRGSIKSNIGEKMNFYKMLSVDQDTTCKAKRIASSLFLPKITHPECGHESWLDSALPIHLSKLSPVRRYLGRAGKMKTVSSHVWNELLQDLQHEIINAGHPVPIISPGMRTGSLQVQMACRGPFPDFLDCTPYHLWSSTLVSLLQSEGLSGFDIYTSSVTAKDVDNNDLILEYHELVVLAEASLSKEANLIEKRCPICNTLIQATYDTLLIDQSRWDGSDFIHAGNNYGELVSERVRNVFKEANILGVEFIPSERISVGTKAKSLTEIRADLKFESQKQEREQIGVTQLNTASYRKK